MKDDIPQTLAIDLFSGAGGLSEGLASVGIQTVLAQELHPQPALTLAFNHPDTDVFVGDIRKLSIDLMINNFRRRYKGRKLDLLVGGPPCQGFSSAGKKEENDPRNSLFLSFFKVAEAFKPKIVLLENVPGFKGMYGGRLYKEAICVLQDLGYKVTDRILNACEYGVPQKRQRFVLVGIRKDIKEFFEWPNPTHLTQSNSSLELFQQNLAKPVTVEEALSDLAFVKPGFEAHRHRLRPSGSFQKSRRGLEDYLFNHLTTRHRDRAVEMFKRIPEGSTISSVPAHLKSAKKTMARLARHEISNAILALPDDLIHYEQNRIPSVREMARLQTFDDDYVFFGKRTSGFMERKVDVPQYTQVGNAVPPLLARALGLSIQKILGAPIRDLRDRSVRLERATWVRGSSGYTGYALGSEAAIILYGINGKQLDLPIDDSQARVVDLPPYINWKTQGRIGMRKQWAPGVPTPPKAAVAV